MKYIFKASALSLATALVLGMSGCGGSSSSSDDGDPISTDTTTSVSGKAIDGYLVYATVCLDINNDGYCQIGVEPVASTDVNGSFSLTVTDAQKSEPGYATAPLLVYGGYDADTNADFTGKLKAPFNNGEAEINVTPISTMVEAMVAQGEDVDAAEAAVTNMLGLPEGTDLGADPVESAGTNPELLRAALQLQKSLEILADALTAAGATENSDDLVEDLYDGLAQHLATATDLNLTAALGAVVDGHDDLDDDALNSATAITGQIELLVDEDGVADTAIIGTQVGALQEEIVVNVIEGNSTVEDVDFDAITAKSFELLHAEEILRIVDFEGSDAEFDALAEKVKDTLVAAGMPSDAFLPVADEIAALKASADADVQDIGSRFEAKMTGFESEAEDLDTFANAETIPFSVPMSFYNFGDSGENGFEYTAHTIEQNGVFTEVRMDFNETSGSFETGDANGGYLVLGDDGSWSNDSVTSYTLSSDNTELTVGSTKVKFIQRIDLANPAPEDEDVLDEINDRVPGDDVVFRTGAEAYVLAFQADERYELEMEAVIDWNASNANSTFSDLQSFLNAKTGSSLVAYNNEYGMSFDIPSGGVTVELGVTGTLSKYTKGDENTAPTFVSANAGTWEVKNIPGTTDLAIFITPNDPEYWNWETQQFYVVYDGAVHEGSYVAASNEFKISDSLEFNQVAFEDIVNAVIPDIPSVNLADVLAGQTLYTTIYDEMGTLESWTFAQDMSSATWTELVGGSESGTGSLSIDGMTMTYTEVLNGSTETATIVITEVYAEYALITINGGAEQRIYFNRAAAEDYFGISSTVIPVNAIALAELIGNDFYDSFLEDNNVTKYIYYGKNTFINETTAQRHEMTFDLENGNLIGEWTLSFPYEITTEGKIKVDIGSGFKYFTRNSVSDTEWGMTIEDDDGQDGTIDTTEARSWYTFKPTDYPSSL